MLQKSEGVLVFPQYKVKYVQHGEQRESYTSDKSWWQKFENKHKHTEIIEFEALSFTDEQHKRLSEVEDTPDAYEHYAAQYALHGLFPDELDEDERLEDHPFQNLQLKKENEALGQSLTSSEIKNFIMENDQENMGQLITDLDIRLLKKEMEG